MPEARTTPQEDRAPLHAIETSILVVRSDNFQMERWRTEGQRSYVLSDPYTYFWGECWPWNDSVERGVTEMRFAPVGEADLCNPQTMRWNQPGSTSGTPGIRFGANSRTGSAPLP